MNDRAAQLLRSLPSITDLLAHAEVQPWLQAMPQVLVADCLRTAVERFREAILQAQLTREVEPEDVIALAEEELTRRSLPSLRKVINATGIVLHTGLGRAPLCDAAIEAIVETASGYCNLEYDLATGKRGERAVHVARRLVELTGAEAAVVVNNNAAATLMILTVFARGREVIVSRGQLIEIGGSFRLPEIMSASGALLCEVGTTNRTRLADYEQAIRPPHTALLMRVHPSNFRVVGFTQAVGIPELAELAHRRGLLAVDDLGSGAIFDLSAHGLPAEPHVRASLAAGADLVCFSGDKLLGGPQCGVILGRAQLVKSIERHPLMRTYRVDKLTLAALEATLRQYVDEHEARRTIPGLAMLTASTDELVKRGDELASLLKQHAPSERFYVGSDSAYAGGGSLPAAALPTVVVRWTPSAASAARLAEALRQAETPVIVRIHEDAICFDLRTLRPDEFEDLAAAVEAVLMDLGEEDDEASEGRRIRLPVL